MCCRSGRAARHGLPQWVVIGLTRAEPHEGADLHAEQAADILALTAEDMPGRRVDVGNLLILIRQDDAIADTAQKPLQYLEGHAFLFHWHNTHL